MSGVRERTKLITHVSHGSRTQYDDYLLGPVVRQLALRLGELKELVWCPLITEEWCFSSVLTA